MNNASTIAMLQAIIDTLRADDPTIDPGTTPPGFVRVNPTGPRGAGKSRLWPMPHPEQGELLLGYATRCMKTIDPTTGAAYYPHGRFGPIMLGAPAGANMAEQLDRIEYAYDWMTQQDLDREAELVARDHAAGDQFSPH